MPKTLLDIRSNITWESAKIQPCSTGMETELSLRHNGRPFEIKFDALPEPGFFRELYSLHTLRSSNSRWRSEGG